MMQKVQEDTDIARELYRRALMGRAQVYQFTGQYPQSLKDWEKYKKVGDEPRHMYAYCQGVSILHDRVGQFKKANMLSEQAIGLGQQYPGIVEAGVLRSARVQLLIKKGDFAEAIKSAEDMLSSTKPTRKGHVRKRVTMDKREEARLLMSMGTAYMSMGKYDQARVHFLRARKINQQINSPEAVSIADNNLTLTYWKMGDYKHAIVHCRKALAIREKIGHVFGISTALNNLGLIHDEMGDYQAALRYYQQALAAFNRLNDVYGITIALTNIGTIYGDVYGDMNKAFDYHRRSLDLVRTTGDMYGEVEALIMMADMYWRCENKHKFSLTVADLSKLIPMVQSEELVMSCFLKEIKLCAWRKDRRKQKQLVEQLFCALAITENRILIYESIAEFVEIIYRFELTSWLPKILPLMHNLENNLNAVESPLRKIKMLRSLVKYSLLTDEKQAAKKHFRNWEYIAHTYRIVAEQSELDRVRVQLESRQ
jgi:tetratricopeptide (TPR) repeat protein